MSSARALSILAAFTLVALSAIPLVPLDRPAWTAGDGWTYATNTTLTAGLNLTGSVVSTVQGQEPTAVGGGSVDAYRVLLSGSGTAAGTVTTSSGDIPVQGNWILTGEERFEPSNLQLVYHLLDLSVNGTYQGVLPYSARVQNTTTFQIVTDDWQYPLLEGMDGSVTVLYNFTQDSSLNGPVVKTSHDRGTGVGTQNFSMGMRTIIETPLGSFQAYPITETWPDGSRQVSFVSASVGNAVRTESYAPDGNLTGATVLTAYRYQALEPPTYLGLTALQWAIVVPVIAAVAVGLAVFRRLRRRTRPRPPKGPEPTDVTSGPRGP